MGIEESEKLGKDMDLQKYLEEQFQMLAPAGHAPEDLKKEVFKTLDTFQLIADVTDLFTVKFTKTNSEFMDMIDNPESNKPDEAGQDDHDENEDDEPGR